MTDEERLAEIDGRRDRLEDYDTNVTQRLIYELVEGDVPWLIGRVRGFEELLQAIAERGPWVEVDGSGGTYELCQWCHAYRGEYWPRGAPPYVSEDPHEPDCLWPKLESLVAQSSRADG